jgi:protein TonB
MTNKPQAAACFAALCALHAAVFSVAGFFTAGKIPVARELPPLVFEFEPAPLDETQAVAQSAPRQEAPAVPVKPPVATEPLEAEPGDAEPSLQEAAVSAISAPAEGAGEQALASASRKMTENDYIALIMRRLEEKKVYPLAMRKRGIEGEMPVRFTIRADGTLAQATAEDSRAHPFLVQAALETVKSASPFPVMEGAEGDFSLLVTIRYELQ